ncbi:MAG: site-specific integrase, partial [Magnetococcales bacterium]|nr:site-specific integrase [Magnetococcales bacterium]
MISTASHDGLTRPPRSRRPALPGTAPGVRTANAAALLPGPRDAGWIDRFLDALLVEHGLSTNTLSSYRGDLAAASHFLHAQGEALLTAGREELIQFIAELSARQLAPASLARKMSALRRFYKFMILNHVRTDDPTRLVENPRMRRRLPHFLNEEEVEALLVAPNRATPGG